MDEPRYILENGTVVRTHAELGSTRGFFVTSRCMEQRQSNALGVIMGVVPGHGGDVYWVSHNSELLPGAYSFSEFELAQGQVP